MDTIDLNKLLDTLTSLEKAILKASLDACFKNEDDNDIPNHINSDIQVTKCPKCESVYFIKNGFDYNHKQKYRCKDCHTIFSSTTDTMFSNSTTSYQKWMTFIVGELNDLTLEQQSEAVGFSKTTCFHMRHKLYTAASKVQKDVVFSGHIEFDPSYTKINLKETKSFLMPRTSKHKTSSHSKSISGISSHKICLITAIDEHDNILFKIGGLGPESLPMFNQFKDHFKKNSLLISDAKAAIIGFAMTNGMRTDSIQPIYGKDVYTTPLGVQLMNCILRLKH